MKDPMPWIKGSVLCRICRRITWQKGGVCRRCLRREGVKV